MIFSEKRKEFEIEEKNERQEKIQEVNSVRGQRKIKTGDQKFWESALGKKKTKPNSGLNDAEERKTGRNPIIFYLALARKVGINIGVES